MYKEVVVGVSLFVAIIVGLVLCGLAADSSSWIIDEHTHCLTLYRSDNHTFSPDHTYVDTFCKVKR